MLILNVKCFICKVGVAECQLTLDQLDSCYFSPFSKRKKKNQPNFHETSRRKTKQSFRTALFLLSASKTFSYFLIVEAKIHFFLTWFSAHNDPHFKTNPLWLKQALAGDGRVATVPGALFSRLDKTQRVLKHYKNIYRYIKTKRRRRRR